MNTEALLAVLDQFLNTPVVVRCSVEKAAPDAFWRKLHAIADRAEPRLREAILRAIAKTVEGVDMTALEQAFARGHLDDAMAAIPWTDVGEPALRAAYVTILTDTYDQAGQATATDLGGRLDMGVSFSLDNPRATAWAESVAATRVTDVSDETVSAIRSILSRGFEEGIHPYDMARMIRGPKDPETGQYTSSVIGLTERQAHAVYNYRDTLQNDDIERSTEQEDRMVERYRDQLVLLRAETIARNETMKASSEGQRELWHQAKVDGYLRGTERRIWIDTGDERECVECAEMADTYGDDTQAIGLDEPYVTPDGEEIMVPSDIHIQCRCVDGLVQADVQDTADAQPDDEQPDDEQPEEGA